MHENGVRRARRAGAPTQTTTLLDFALDHRRRGWRILPNHNVVEGCCSCNKADCDTRGKHPRILQWQKFATTDERVIRSWWTKWPAANIGIATGQESHLLVLDVDPRHGGAESLADLEAQHGPLPETVEALTGGSGRHLFFRYPAEGEWRNKQDGGLAPGLDIRGEGGQVVAVGSVHESGRSYQWEARHGPEDVELADPPAWLLDLIGGRTATSDPLPEGSRGVPLPLGRRARDFVARGAPIGRQRETAVATARNLLANGHSVEETADLLWRGFVASTWEKGRNPWTYEDALAIAQDIASSSPPPLRERPSSNGRRPPGDGDGDDENGGDRHDIGDPDTHVVHLTELGNARRLVAQHGADLRYSAALGWLAYDGIRWRRDGTGEVDRRAKATVMHLYHDAADEPDQERRKALVEHARRSEQATQIKNMIALAKSEPDIPVRINDLDCDPWALNVINGTLDLRTGALRPHRRDDLITKLAPVAYDPDASAPLWCQFLDRIMDSNRNLIGFLQRMFGLCLTGVTAEQVIFMLYGTGANGKSTAVNTGLAVLGDYGRMAAPGLLLKRRHEAHPTERADLYGARLIASVEVDRGRALAEALVKEMTGGERMKGRLMFRDFFEWEPTHKLVLCCNHRPGIRGTDNAIWRRIKLTPFTVAVPPEEQDPLLVQKLAEERAGILTWMLEGCLAWQRHGLGTPEEVTNATNAYRAEMDVLGAFLVERTYQGPNARCTVKAMYEAYKAWCESNGERVETKNDLSTLLTERGFTPRRTGKQGSFWEGVGLVDDTRGV